MSSQGYNMTIRSLVPTVLIVILGLHFFVAKQLMQLSACVLQEVNTLVCTLLLSYLPH